MDKQMATLDTKILSRNLIPRLAQQSHSLLVRLELEPRHALIRGFGFSPAYFLESRAHDGKPGPKANPKPEA